MHHDHASTPFRTSLLEENDGPGANLSANPTMGEIISMRFSRRGFLHGSLAVSAIATTVSPIALLLADEARAEAKSTFAFKEVEAGIDQTHHVAEGYDAEILLRWGDRLFADAPEFDPKNQNAEAQARQFGYNNDFIGFIPLDGATDRGLLFVNHEYTSEHLMFPGVVTIVEKEGKKVIEVAASDQGAGRRRDGRARRHYRRDPQGGGKWQVVKDGEAQPPHHRDHRDDADRAGGRP